MPVTALRKEPLRIESITVSGFRCFGPNEIVIPISDKVTTIVGPNAAGKTALLQAMSKLFGVTRAQRTVLLSDFHLALGEDPESRNSKELFIEALIAFPELMDGSATPETIAPSFRHMLITRAAQAPVCRMRLEAQWDDDGTLEGEVSQNLFWIDSLDADPAEDKYQPVAVTDRGLIQLYYTPASRDAAGQVRTTAGTLAARLLRAIEWSSDTEDKVQEATESLTAAFESESAITAITEALQTRWADLHDDASSTKPRLSLVSRRFEEVINKIAVIFEQGPDKRERGIEALSDGHAEMSLESIKSLVEELTTLHISRGVQPSDLIDNGFEDAYVESAFRKTSDGAVFEITFLEDDENELPVEVAMRYTYDSHRYLVLIEQKVAAKRFAVQWDRAASIHQRLAKLQAMLSTSLPREKVAAILSTLPTDFVAMFPRLKLVA